MTNSQTPLDPPPDFWRWAAVGMLGVLQILLQLNESEMIPNEEALTLLRGTREQLDKILDEQSGVAPLSRGRHLQEER